MWDADGTLPDTPPLKNQASGLQDSQAASERRGWNAPDPEGGEGRTMNRTQRGDVHFTDGELGISQCVWCRHRSADGGRCRAFPGGIPEAIAKNRHDHRNPFDQDQGLRFEPEKIEIEFIDVEPERESVSLTTDLVIAMARLGNVETQTEAAEVMALDKPELELAEDAFELDTAASG